MWVSCLVLVLWCTVFSFLVWQLSGPEIFHVIDYFITLSPSTFAIIWMLKRRLVALLSLSSWCLVTVSVLWLFLTLPTVSLQFVIVVFPDHTHLLFYHFSLYLTPL